ncbi:hypothetical protein D3C87_1787950 [compost metagenome]
MTLQKIWVTNFTRIRAKRDLDDRGTLTEFRFNCQVSIVIDENRRQHHSCAIFDFLTHVELTYRSTIATLTHHQGEEARVVIYIFINHKIVSAVNFGFFAANHIDAGV